MLWSNMRLGHVCYSGIEHVSETGLATGAFPSACKLGYRRAYGGLRYGSMPDFGKYGAHVLLLSVCFGTIPPVILVLWPKRSS